MGKNESSVHQLATEMGEVLLENGAEISRVQDTMERVARAYHAESFNAYVLTNGIFMSGRDTEGHSLTFIKQYGESSIHFGRICAVNQLSREIARGEHTVEEAFSILEDIRQLPYCPLLPATLSCALGSAAFSYLFGGCWLDALAAFLCGLALEPFLYLTKKHGLSNFLVNLSSSGFVAFLASLLFMVGLGNNLDKIIIGSIIRLVPGVALTTSIRDFFNRDYLSGTIRMIDAVLIGSCIAIGVGLVVRLMSPLTGGSLL